MLIKLFLKTTDNFLFYSVKNAFEKAENRCQQEPIKIDVLKELKSFEENPLGCVIGVGSKFETNLKIKIKIVLGLFFVLIPVLGFGAISYFLTIPQTYAFIATFIVAILAASRMDEISRRYVQSRALEFAH
ncbi:MAG: hypothetical protein U9Q40_08455 [Campylobacterota bacterium]|nr:hypothetical protein [Campylobacterota bacterium]